MRGNDPTGGGHERGPAQDVRGQEIRVRLVGAALLLAAVLALPVITSFTSLLNGTVGGVGAGDVAAIGEFLLAMLGAIAYCRWAGARERAS